jgi:periplasmic mercuric ion binding protein
MKKLAPTIVLIVALLSVQSLQAQSDKSERTIGIKTETLDVKGVCSMCKKRIETTALSVYGVKAAAWNENSKKLTLDYTVFVPEVVADVEKKLVAVGHDTGKSKATDADYLTLPDCCKYRNSNMGSLKAQ